MTSPSFDLACIGRAAVDLYGEQVGAPLEDTATFARYLDGPRIGTLQAADDASGIGGIITFIAR